MINGGREGLPPISSPPQPAEPFVEFEWETHPPRMSREDQHAYSLNIGLAAASIPLIYGNSRLCVDIGKAYFEGMNLPSILKTSLLMSPSYTGTYAGVHSLRTYADKAMAIRQNFVGR